MDWKFAAHFILSLGYVPGTQLQQQHICRSMCKRLLRCIYQNLDDRKRKFTSSLNWNWKPVSEMGPWSGCISFGAYYIRDFTVIHFVKFSIWIPPRHISSFLLVLWILCCASMVGYTNVQTPCALVGNLCNFVIFLIHDYSQKWTVFLKKVFVGHILSTLGYVIGVGDWIPKLSL